MRLCSNIKLIIFLSCTARDDRALRALRAGATPLSMEPKPEPEASGDSILGARVDRAVVTRARGPGAKGYVFLMLLQQRRLKMMQYVPRRYQSPYVGQGNHGVLDLSSTIVE
jgi:hypothetical protein